MEDILRTAIDKYKHLCDYMEIRVEDYENLNINIKTGDTQILEGRELGGNVRVLINGGWGFTSFNDLSLLNEFAEKAVKQAEKLGKLKFSLAPVPPAVDIVRPELIRDPRGITMKEKVELFNRYNNLVLNYDKKHMRNTFFTYKEELKRKYFSNSEGTFLDMEIIDMDLIIMITASKGDYSKSVYIMDGSSNNFNICYGKEEELEKNCRELIKHLDAPKIKSGNYTVICDNEVSSVFVHESFGHNCEGDRYKSEAMKKEMANGRILGSKILNVYDTGLDEGMRGCTKYDDEGVKTEKTYLIKNGVLSGKLHTRETAADLGEKPTGSARALNYKFPPIPRMRNTCIENGESHFSDMIKDVDNGIYVSKGAGGTGGEMFTIIPVFSYIIKNGEITTPVGGVKITGNLFETLKNIDMVGNDFKLRGCGAGCGKYSQFPLPVSLNSPSIRIQNLSIGGEYVG